MDDFLIIGGGIAGCSTAARLAQLGTVTVLETEEALGYHASGRSAALFEENYGSPSTVALNRASRGYLAQAEVLSPRGILMLGLAHEAEAFEATRAELRMDVISVGEARDRVAIVGAQVSQAAYFGQAMDIDTDRLLQGFARDARRHGAAIRTGAQVTGIARQGGGWAVTTKAGAHEARLLVNAAGAWADQVAQLAGVAPLGLVPYRRSMARIPAPGGHDVKDWPMLFGPGETWYAKPDAGKLLVSPADEDPVPPQDAWAEDMVLAEGLARYEAHVSQPVTRVETSWAGLRTFAPDRSLVIGADPVESGFFWVAGQGGYGMQSSAGYSQLAADLIAGRRPELDADVIAALDPGRFSAA